MMRPDNLSSPGLIPSVMSAMKTYGDKKALIKEAALKGNQLAVVQTIMNLDLSQQEQSKMRASTVENARVRRIAVFGYHLDANYHGVAEKDSESVIIRTVPLTRKNEDSVSSREGIEISDYRLFEIGVNIKGTYIAIQPVNLVDLNDMLKTSGLRLNKDDRVDFFQFVPPGTHCPSSKPIEDILSSSEDGDSFSHVLLTVETGGSSKNAQSEIADAGGRFLVDMKRVGSVVTEGMRYQPLAVEPAASVSTSDDGRFTKTPFRRLAVLMPPSMSEHENRLGKLSRDMEKGEGFSESAEILAEVLSLVLIDDTNLDRSIHDEIIQKNLKQNPLLLYYTSMELLDTVNPRFAMFVAEYWEEKLCFTGSNFAHLSKHEQEAREIILSLITLHRSSFDIDRQPQHPTMGNGLMTPRDPLRRSSQAMPSQDFLLKLMSSRVNVGKRVALASEAHLAQLPGLVSTETHFAQEEIYVEETNFESTLQRLKRASPTSLTFVFVYITGRISADQMSQIVTVPVPAIKLIFRYSSSIVDLLELIPTISDLVHKPKSILEELSGKLRPVPYSRNSAVGSVVEFTMSKLKMDPCLISTCRDKDGRPIFWDGDGPEQAVAEASQWRLNVQKWLQAKTEGESAFVRILVTTDDKATVKALSSFLESNVERVKVRVVDAGDPSKFDDLKQFMDSTPATLHYSDRHSAMGLSSTALGEGETNVLPPREIFILSRASFLPHARLEVLVSRCAKRGTRLLLLVAEATSSMSRFRMFKDPRAPPVWIRVPILKQRLMGGVAGVETVDFSQSSDRVMLAFVGLQLILSPEAVVSEEHKCMVRQFVESNDANGLEFLDQYDSLDPSTRSEMLRALADLSHDDKLCLGLMCRLAVVLAVHVNRYVRFRTDPQSPLVSFSDFCRQPTVRFLSQIHRLEAYMWFLFDRTSVDRRVLSDATKDMPYGFPLGRCLTELTDRHNIHHASQPGQILMCTLMNTKDLALNEKGKLALPMLPMPQYIDPGKGDVVTQMQEIVEHRALASSELHWNEMYDRWQSGPELTDDVLEHILVNSACRISVLLSMTPAQIFNLTLSREATVAVSQDFDSCAKLLRSMSVKEFPVLRTRAAAIWWLLLLAGASVERVDDKVFCEEQGLLLDAGIYIEPRANHSEQERIDLLSRVTRVMIQLDMDHTLTSQHGVRSFLLSDERRDTISPMLDDPKVKLGNAFMNAIVARETLNAIMAGTSGSAIFERLGEIMQWVKESKEADAHRMSRQMANFASRITPDALVTLLKSANPPLDLTKARDGVLLPCLRAQIDQNEQRSFLDAVLEPLCREKPEMAVEVLEILAKCDEYQFPKPQLKNLPEFWPLLFRAFETRDPSLAEEFFLKVHDHVNSKDQNFALPFESSPSLCSMYVDSCKQQHESKADSAEVLDRHTVVLKSELSRTAVFKHLRERQPEIENHKCLLALLYYVWWAEPGASIPLPLLPKASAPETWELFKAITRRLRPISRTVSKGMSILARFAIAPHTVPASILNTLKKTMVGGIDIVETKTYVLAQMDSTTYPVYAFRTHTRTLPKECKEHLTSICRGPRLWRDFESENQADKMRLLFPLTDSGLSQKTVSHNLNILVNIKHAECTIDPDHTSILQAQLFLTVWTWFEAAGFTMQDLKQMCASEEEKGRLNANRIDMKAVYESANFAQKLVYQALPVYVDVRFCSGKDVPLFQISQESVALTMQWLHMLTMQYDCCLDSPQQFYNYTDDRINGRAHDPSLPSQIVTRIFQHIAGDLMKKHRDLNLIETETKGGHGSHHILFVLDDSGSMGGHWSGLVTAVKHYLSVRQGKGMRDLISIVIFNSTARVQCDRMPLLECSRNLDSILRFVGGGTAFGPALRLSLELLLKQNQDLPIAMLFMSDGCSGDGDQEMREIVSKFPQIKVDTMAFGNGADHGKLQTLANIASGTLRIGNFNLYV
jgi:hypothetical protein